MRRLGQVVYPFFCATPGNGIPRPAMRLLAEATKEVTESSSRRFPTHRQIAKHASRQYIVLRAPEVCGSPHY